MVTDCIINELKQLGDRYYGAFIASRSYERIRNCKHAPGTLSAIECIREQLGTFIKFNSN